MVMLRCFQGFLALCFVLGYSSGEEGQGYLRTRCSSNTDCPITNSYCNMGRCICYWNYQEVITSYGDECVLGTTPGPNRQGLGSVCDSNSDCPTEYSECQNGLCTCFSGYTPVNNSSDSECVYVPTSTPVYYLGTRCYQNAACPIQNSYCQSYRCACYRDYKAVLNSSGDRCVYSPRGFPEKIGDKCDYYLDCIQMDRNSYCLFGKCQCKFAYQEFRGGCVPTNMLEAPYFYPILIAFVVLLVIACFCIVYLLYRSIWFLYLKLKSIEYKKVLCNNPIVTFSKYVPMERTTAPKTYTDESNTEELNGIDHVEDLRICISEDLPFITEKNDSTC